MISYFLEWRSLHLNKYTHLEAAERSNKSLHQAHVMMENELQRMRRVNHTLLETSDKLNKTSGTYSKYSDNLSVASKVLNAIQTREFIESFVQTAAMYFFFATWVYIFCERFYIYEILTVIVNVFTYLLACALNTVRSFIPIQDMFDEAIMDPTNIDITRGLNITKDATFQYINQKMDIIGQNTTSFTNATIN